MFTAILTIREFCILPKCFLALKSFYGAHKQTACKTLMNNVVMMKKRYIMENNFRNGNLRNCLFLIGGFLKHG